ncbi:PREDICTED: coiled-coil domain-containing protein 36 [Crocodylus porosus]|uniref:coiled-coil domain-containing protein 36 n=1 Tax=Crocodylus porosus TaxID=8502 RepID=UPI000938B16E|nr:PREDICTED: coiled-coil domain-containing protein 36 [Crocodylus porosus]
MNFNVCNIKEMFSTPTATGPNKLSIRSSTLSDYSSLSDSQFLFGSQFCPENSQPASVPREFGALSRQPRSSQQNSQDSEPSIFTKYQTKPQLFGGDVKEKGSLNFGAGKLKSVLEQFEINKKKIKDKHNSEVLLSFISHVKESLQGMQACLDKFEEILNSRNKSILDGLEAISKTLQDAAQSHYGLVLNALADKRQMEQMLLEMEQRLAAKDVEILDMKSNWQLLKESLELLTAQQNEQHMKLCEQLGCLQFPNILTELQTFISTSRLPSHVQDNTSQTSPSMFQDLFLSQGKTCHQCYQTMRVCRIASFQTQPHTVTMLNQPDDSNREIAGDDTHRSDSNTGSGRKAGPITAALQDKENVTIQEAKSALERHAYANKPRYACCCSTGISKASHQKHQLLPQEKSCTTPLRKAGRKEFKGTKTMTCVQENQSHISFSPVQNYMAEQTDKATGHIMMQKASLGNRLKKEKSKQNHRSKVTVWKRMYFSKKKGEFSKCPDNGLKKKMTNGCMEQEDAGKNGKPQDTITLQSENSAEGSSAPSQQKLSRAPHRKSEDCLPVLHPCENMELPAARRKGMLEGKNGMGIFSASRNPSLWDSSSQESSFSLYNLKDEKQRSLFSLPSSTGSAKSCLSVSLAQQKTTTFCSLTFDSDYSD